LGFYGVLAMTAVAIAAGAGSRRWWLAALVGWAGIGLVVMSRVDRPGEPEAEVLAVDHGLAVLIRSAEGRATLYDCGKLNDPHVGRRVIAPALWSRGLGRIDQVILSHADSDHYNGLPDLLDRFAVGEV